MSEMETLFVLEYIATKLCQSFVDRCENNILQYMAIWKVFIRNVDAVTYSYILQNWTLLTSLVIISQTPNPTPRDLNIMLEMIEMQTWELGISSESVKKFLHTKIAIAHFLAGNIRLAKKHTQNPVLHKDLLLTLLSSSSDTFPEELTMPKLNKSIHPYIHNVLRKLGEPKLTILIRKQLDQCTDQISKSTCAKECQTVTVLDLNQTSDNMSYVSETPDQTVESNATLPQSQDFHTNRPAAMNPINVTRTEDMITDDAHAPSSNDDEVSVGKETPLTTQRKCSSCKWRSSLRKRKYSGSYLKEQSCVDARKSIAVTESENGTRSTYDTDAFDCRVSVRDVARKQCGNIPIPLESSTPNSADKASDNSRVPAPEAVQPLPTPNDLKASDNSRVPAPETVQLLQTPNDLKASGNSRVPAPEPVQSLLNPDDEGHSCQWSDDESVTVNTRMRRVIFSRQEERYLAEGVRMYGSGNWSKILKSYKFHPCRTNISIKDKYRTMRRQGKI